MNVSLSPETQKLLEEQVRKGCFRSADEAIRAALRSLDGATHIAEVVDLPAERREQIEKILVERLQSGPAKEMADADFDAIRVRLDDEIIRRRGV